MGEVPLVCHEVPGTVRSEETSVVTRDWSSPADKGAVHKREKESLEGEKSRLPWGRGGGAWGKLAGPGEGVRIRCTGAGLRHRRPSMDLRDPFLRRFHLQQKKYFYQH